MGSRYLPKNPSQKRLKTGSEEGEEPGRGGSRRLPETEVPDDTPAGTPSPDPEPKPRTMADIPSDPAAPWRGQERDSSPVRDARAVQLAHRWVLGVGGLV